MSTSVAKGVAVAALVVLAGCGAGGVTTFEADAAVVSQSVVADTDYEFNGTTSETINRTFEVAGSEQDVTVTNKISTYEKSVEFPGVGSRRVAAVVVLSSPSISIGGSEFNPLADYTAQDLANTVGERRSGLSVGERQGTSTVETLGTETRVTRFAGTQSLGPTTVDVVIQVTKVKHEGDFVVTFAVYPTRLDDAETVRRMIGALVHPA
ncbi:MAG: DUF6517 family protein [Haloferacaceae archaeon]